MFSLEPEQEPDAGDADQRHQEVCHDRLHLAQDVPHLRIQDDAEVAADDTNEGEAKNNQGKADKAAGAPEKADGWQNLEVLNMMGAWDQ